MDSKSILMAAYACIHSGIDMGPWVSAISRYSIQKLKIKKKPFSYVFLMGFFWGHLKVFLFFEF
jgi:hypothetical protein